MPVTKPSALNSMAGETTALAKPVIGTIVPAPAIFAMSSYQLSPVSTALRKTSEMAVATAAASLSSPAAPQPFKISCPSAQMTPPIKKLQRRSFQIGDFFARLATYLLYS